LLTAVQKELETVSGVLGLLTGNVLETCVETDVPSVLGVSSVDDVDYESIADVVKVLTIAQWKGWQKAYDVASTRFDVKAGSADVKQSQMFANISKRLLTAETAALRYSEVQAAVSGSSGQGYVSSTSTYGSPYNYSPDEFGI
jgi:hypothetical protein